MKKNFAGVAVAQEELKEMEERVSAQYMDRADCKVKELEEQRSAKKRKVQELVTKKDFQLGLAAQREIKGFGRASVCSTC